MGDPTGSHRPSVMTASTGSSLPHGSPGGVDRNLYLGVDLGTTGLKVGVFDEAGNHLAAGRAEYVLHSPHDGWAEQDAKRWWEAFESSLRQVRERVDLERIAAICTVGQSPTVVPVDGSGKDLRPAITWADRRATAEARWLSETLGGTINVDFEVLPRILWIRNNEPEIYSRTRWFFQPYDYLAFRLTGEPITIDPHRQLRPWSDERLEAAGLDRTRFPASSLPPGQIIGCVQARLAEELGLSRETLVVSGTVDAFAHWVGVDLAKPGRLCNIGGTSEGASLAWDEPLHDPQFRVFGVPSPFGSGSVVGGSMSNGGSLLDWAVRALHGEGATRQQVLDAIDRVPPGSNGLVALPYFLGERTPIYDADARGVFFGVNPGHGAQHFSRALLEGVAMGLRQIIEILDSLGGRTDEITATGGTTQAAVWNRIKANVTGRRLRVPAVKDSGVLGAAILARSAASAKPLAHVSEQMVRYSEVIEPDNQQVAVYDEVYPLFLELYQGVRKPFGHLARLGLQT